MNDSQTIGILGHSAEGSALCFITACRDGQQRMGAHYHPEVVLSCIPMGLSMEAWEADDHDEVAKHLLRGVDQVAAAGADFFVCPDNTAHIVLEKFADRFAIPGIHIADVVAAEMERNGWKKAALLGTKWTMTGDVYPAALARRGRDCIHPGAETRAAIDAAIFDELCQGIIRPETVRVFEAAIETLKAEGADCAILGCTEIPLIITNENSALPVLDSTRLLAGYAVETALADRPVNAGAWLTRD